MTNKILNALLIVTSLIVYLEWGGDQHTYLYQAEADFLHNLVVNPQAAVHFFTVIPFLGQVLLLTSLLQSKPGKWLTLAGLGCLFVLIGFIFLTGLIVPNAKVIISTLPFLVTSVVTILYRRSQIKKDKHLRTGVR